MRDWLWWCGVVACVCVVMGVGTTARAQAPINSNVALQPARGGLIWRQQIRFASAGRQTLKGAADITQVGTVSTLAYGVSDFLTLIFDTPIVLSRRIEIDSSGRSDVDSGLGDVRLLGKVRLYRDDFGINDTARFDFIGGVEVPSGSDAFSSDSVNPIVGGVYSYMQGRHAFDVDVLWKFNTAGQGRGADVLKYDLAYIYRVAPEVYASVKPTAWFAGVEFNGIAETNGDQEVFVSPGVQYVTRRWIFEATVQVPVWQELDHRAAQDYVVGFGFRVQY